MSACIGRSEAYHRPVMGRLILFSSILVFLTLSAPGLANPAFDPEAVAQAFFAQHAAACRAAHCDNGPSFFGQFAGNIAIVLGFTILTLSGVAARIVRRIERTGWRTEIQAVIFALLGTLCWRLFLLPINYYAERFAANPASRPTPSAPPPVIYDRKGFTTVLNGKPPDFWGWLNATLFHNFFVTFFIVAICMAIALRLRPRLDSRIWIAPLTMAAFVGAYFAETDNSLRTPNYMAESTMLPLTETSAQMQTMAAKHGIDPWQLRVEANINNLAQPLRGDDNARVVGMGTGRGIYYTNSLIPIVPFQTINGKAPQPANADMLMAITGHEIAHHDGGDLFQMMLFDITIKVVTTAAILLCVALFLKRKGRLFGVASPYAAAAWPLYGAVFVFSFMIEAAASASIQRQYEARADRVGLDIARDPDAFARVILRLHQGRPLEFSPAVEMLLNNHPSGKARIRAAMEWKARHLSEKPSRFKVPEDITNAANLARARIEQNSESVSVNCVLSKDPIPKTDCTRGDAKPPSEQAHPSK